MSIKYLEEWHKTEGDGYPELLDKESFRDYVVIRRNVTLIVQNERTYYEYDEKMIPRTDWNVYEDVLSVTPYTDSKTAYIDDTEVTFADVPQGNLSLFMVDGDNQPVPCTYERINGNVRVSFEQRTSLATVTIQIS